MISDDPIQIMSRLRGLMGDIDRAHIDLRRLELGATPEVKALARPLRDLTGDCASKLQHLLELLENTPEYQVAKRNKDGSV